MNNAELERLAREQARAYEKMLELEGGVGLLGLRHPEMFQSMLRWDDATRNDHADTVLALIEQLAAAQAVIAEANAVESQQGGEAVNCAEGGMRKVLSGSRADALQAHDRQVTATALRDAAVALWGDETAEAGTTKAMYHAIYATWLEQRAVSLVPGNPEPTEGEN